MIYRIFLILIAKFKKKYFLDPYAEVRIPTNSYFQNIVDSSLINYSVHFRHDFCIKSYFNI